MRKIMEAVPRPCLDAIIISIVIPIVRLASCTKPASDRSILSPCSAVKTNSRTGYAEVEAFKLFSTVRSARFVLGLPPSTPSSSRGKLSRNVTCHQSPI
jgi:hypothetical protein